VSASGATSPEVASYARPLGATLIAFGMAVLGMGESESRYYTLYYYTTGLLGWTCRSPLPCLALPCLAFCAYICWTLNVRPPGTHRYFMVQRSLPQGFFPAARLSVFLQAVSLGTLVGIVFGILVAVR
jgi:hypothetical protein